MLRNLMQDIKESSRFPEYYKTDNSPEINDKIYKQEIYIIENMISKYKHDIVSYLDINQIKKLNKLLYERAALWHQFRNEGLNMPKEKFERLIILEENLYGGEVDKIWGMVEELKRKENKHVYLSPQNSTGDTLKKTEDILMTYSDNHRIQVEPRNRHRHRQELELMR